MTKRTNIQLVVIDPQNDFCDLPGAALPVTGANADMERLAKFITRAGKKLEDIHVTLDSHRFIDIAQGLSIFLPDTFGSDFFLDHLSDEDLRQWKGFRWDSGDPIKFGDRIIARYEARGVDPTKKMLIPSDGLTLADMLKLDDHFYGRIKVSDGWGTNLTNDLFDNVWNNGLWYGPLSLVVKAATANGHPLVKLSDNLAKATGLPADVERYKHAAGYTNTEYTECVY
jgi:nicotinic acid phosphoribosyltransferase